MDQEDQQKIEFLKQLVSSSPSGSVFFGNGLYGNNISGESFLKLFPEADSNNRSKVHYSIVLSEQNKHTFLDVIESEKIKLIYDLIHFHIELDGKTIANGFDQFICGGLNKSFYADLLNAIPTQFDELEYSATERFDD